METEELEEVGRHSRKSVHGHRKDSSSQAVSCVDLIHDDESEASDHVTEKEPQTHYIPIRRNSKYYRSFRRRNREKGKSSREVQAENVEASLKNGNAQNELLNKDELLRIFHKGLSLHVKRDMTAGEEQWLQRYGNTSASDHVNIFCLLSFFILKIPDPSHMLSFALISRLRPYWHFAVLNTVAHR